MDAVTARLGNCSAAEPFFPEASGRKAVFQVLGPMAFQNFIRFIRPLPFAFVLIVISTLCHAQEVRVGIGFAIPPYVIQEKDAGVEVDVIREAFKAAGHEAVFVYLPNLRLPLAFAQGKVDCIASNAAYDLAKDSKREVFPSDTTVVFQNFAVTIEDRKHSINSIQDLADKRVLGFNNARKYLGAEFAAMAQENTEYAELADQSLQVRMLYSGRVDTIITDKRIFLWWRGKLAGSPLSETLHLKRPVSFHPIFPSAPRHVAFAIDSLRDAFNDGLEKIRSNGVFAGVVARYVGLEHNE